MTPVESAVLLYFSLSLYNVFSETFQIVFEKLWSINEGWQTSFVIGCIFGCTLFMWPLFLFSDIVNQDL